MAKLGDGALEKFKVKVIAQINKEFPFFPEISQSEQAAFIGAAVDSAFSLDIKIEKAVFNFAAACWLSQRIIQNSNDSAVINELRQSTLSDVDKTEKLKRQATLTYFSRINNGSR